MVAQELHGKEANEVSQESKPLRGAYRSNWVSLPKLHQVCFLITQQAAPPVPLTVGPEYSYR